VDNDEFQKIAEELVIECRQEILSTFKRRLCDRLGKSTRVKIDFGDMKINVQEVDDPKFIGKIQSIL